MVCSDNQKGYDESLREIKERKNTLSNTLKDLFDEAIYNIECLKSKKKQDV
jgi:hypothetical protein